MNLVHSGKVEDFRRLDIREMQRAGLFRVAWSGVWQWKDPTSLRVRASIAVETRDMSLTLRYKHGSVVVIEALWLRHVPCKFGGSRVLASCPSCKTSCSVLYLRSGVFRCRRCHGLKYTTQSETKHGRLAIKRDKLSAKLAGSTRPKGMHKKTYLHIRQALIKTKTDLSILLKERLGL